MPAHQIATVPLSPTQDLREAMNALNQAALAALTSAAGRQAGGPPRVVVRPADYADDPQIETWRYGSKQLGLRTEIRVYSTGGPAALDWRQTFSGLSFGRLYGYGRLERDGQGYATLMVDAPGSDVVERATGAFRDALLEAGLHAGSWAEAEDLATLDRVLSAWRAGAGLPAPERAALADLVDCAEASSPAGLTARFALARAQLSAAEALVDPSALVEEASALLHDLLEHGPALRFARGLASGLSAHGALHFLYQPYASPPPRPRQEVLLALARAEERMGRVDQARARLGEVLALGDLMPPHGITPAGEARAQLARLTRLSGVDG